ncbi:MAG TPA: TIM-barrel domain-containing protein [Terriglobales bacterium]|nr:TIM-barrel domain-containing protein [Terriglobales bacterium]
MQIFLLALRTRTLPALRSAAMLAVVFTALSGCDDDLEPPAPLPSATPSVSPTPHPSATLMPTVLPTATVSPSPSPPFTATLSATASPSPTPSPTAVVDQNPVLGEHYQLRFDAAASTLELRRAEETLLRFPADGLQLGRVDGLDQQQNYDPYPIAAGIPLLRSPAGLRWLSPTAARVVAAAGDSFRVELSYPENNTARLDAKRSRDGNFALRLTPDGNDPPIAIFRLRPRAARDEAFYGLGEYFDSVNHRGRIRAMQLEVDSTIESSNNEAHVPVPLLIGTRGWGLFVESPYPASFDVASQAADLVDVMFGTGFASTEGLPFHLFAAEHPLDITRHYYDVTGYPVLPDRWALGPLLWRDENRDQAEVENDIETMRDLDLATTGMWIDRPYASGVNTFDFDPARYPDPQAMIDKVHALGLRLGLWHTPYLDRDDDDTAPLLAEARAEGYLPPRNGLLLNPWGVPIDFTNPGAFEWWQGLIQRYIEMGIEGFKLDYAEDVVPGIAGARNIWRFHDGSDERTMHHGYTPLYHRAYAELLPESGGFLLARAGKYGGQRYARIIWPGDLDANFAKHREVITEEDGDTYVAVGGLPAALIAGLSLGPSGYPFYGSDTGGYQHSPPDKETFVRWFEQTALSTVMQVGTSSNDVPWEFNERNGFDQESLDLYRIYARLHLRLFPYLWTYAQRLASDGRAIQRPLGLAYPELGVHPDDTYLFGDSLLVAPVVERGARTRTLTFPAGAWADWWTGEIIVGGTAVTVEAPLSELPLFVRVGDIIPMLRPTIDTLSPTDFPERVDSYATTAGVLTARTTFGSGEIALFDGTRLATVELGGALLRLQSSTGAEFRSGVLWEVFGFDGGVFEIALGAVPLPQRASLAELDAVDRGWTRTEDAGGTLYVKVPPGQQVVELNASSPAS